MSDEKDPTRYLLPIPHMKDQALIALRTAKERIEKNGWCQKKYRAKNGAYNIFGALGMKSHRMPSLEEKRELIECCVLVLDKITRVHQPHRFRSGRPYDFAIKLWSWNDSPRRTKKHVLSTLDKAIMYVEGWVTHPI